MIVIACAREKFSDFFHHVSLGARCFERTLGLSLFSQIRYSGIRFGCFASVIWRTTHKCGFEPTIKFADVQSYILRTFLYFFDKKSAMCQFSEYMAYIWFHLHDLISN